MDSNIHCYPVALEVSLNSKKIIIVDVDILPHILSLYTASCERCLSAAVGAYHCLVIDVYRDSYPLRHGLLMVHTPI